MDGEVVVGGGMDGVAIGNGGGGGAVVCGMVLVVRDEAFEETDAECRAPGAEMVVAIIFGIHFHNFSLRALKHCFIICP